MVCCACKNQVSSDPFFKALSQTLSQSLLSVEGEYGMDGLVTSFDYEQDLDEKEMIYIADNEEVYIRDGVVYTLISGEENQESLEQSDWKDFSLNQFNPFVSVSQSERQQLFDSVTQSGDTYSLVFNPSRLAVLLDSYGAISVKDGQIRATIHEGFLNSLDFTLEGSLLIGSGSPFSYQAKLVFSIPEQLDFPDLAGFSETVDSGE